MVLVVSPEFFKILFVGVVLVKNICIFASAINEVEFKQI
ncbi:hypothetical protein MNBD_BACTEROID03-1408 [hydrothermal vent metagenome]|uniref:Uncharacterized protein n=1 Tax=hydrothermal vent metagenome TaxID=652676 RepID=A0A3B0SZR4_9ZZZZ